MNVFDGKYAMLLRRELWEHKALWRAPAAVGAFVIIALLFGGHNSLFTGPQAGISVNSDIEVSDELVQMFGRGVTVVLAFVLGAVAALAAFAYLLDCLYAERKDRSILFWKSLPVSDAQTVLAKLALVMLGVPLLTALLVVVAQPLVLGTLYLRFEGLRNAIGLQSVWGGLKSLPQLAGLWLYGVVWYAPVATYLMLASVLARRVPLMYAVMPPALIILMEGLLRGTAHANRFFIERLVPWMRPDWNWSLERDPFGRVVGLGSPDWAQLLRSPDLWLGLAAAAGMVYIVIRLRRYRDDT